MDAGGAPGFFGKVPAVGDFVSRRLPRDFLDPWDEWLQAAIASSHEQLEEAWLDAYLTSPVWRFALAGGVAGPRPCSGILMPSVDKAGRYFPITLVTFLSANTNLFTLAGASQSWYESAEDVALSVLAETSSDVEALDNSVIALGQLDTLADDGRHELSEGDEGIGQKSMHVSMSSITEVKDTFSLMARRFAELQFGAYSLWWGTGSEQITPATMLCNGLPPVAGYSAMLSGDWKQYGWDDLSRTPETPNSTPGNDFSL